MSLLSINSSTSSKSNFDEEPTSRTENGIASRWYVAATRPRKECIAEINLSQQSFRTFNPFILRSRKIGRRVEQVRAPAFPGYIFVAIDLKRDRWRSINGTLGVRHLLLGDRQLPVPMPVPAMDYLFSRCDGAHFVDSCGELVSGAAVRIMNGPFAGRLASLDTADDQGRIRVLLDILGSKQSVTLQPGAVEPVF